MGLTGFKKLPQCPECGALDPHITSDQLFCSTCAAAVGAAIRKSAWFLPSFVYSNIAIASDTASTVDKIQAAASAHTNNASRHRLNQLPRAQNANLAKANTIVQQRTNIHKPRSRLEYLSVDVEVWIYPKNGKAARKV